MSYAEHKKRVAADQREQVAAGQDIGDLPPVADPERRRACSRSLQLHLETYHAATFYLGWSDDHLRAIALAETAILDGGQFAMAMPRGTGKTAISEGAIEWSALNGFHPFSCLIGSDESAAEGMLDSIKTELEVNDELAADYPEVCLAIQALEGIANRCKGQTYGGERTRIVWTNNKIILPTVRPAGWLDLPDHREFVRDDGYSLASGAIIKVAGLTGGIRGMKHKRADGATVRPTLVVPDDPQTDQSARSPSQCESRERILAGAVLGLAGPGKAIAAVMPCTVIRKGDMADRILDRDLHPEWHGTRTQLVYRFPANERLWEEYGRIRADAMKADRGAEECNAFYRANRAAMDEGAVVAWADRKRPDELSAIQHAMNLRFDRGDRAFFAEFQNDPIPEEDSRPDDLTADQIAAKVNRHPRGVVPAECTKLTSFIDVQGSLLFYVVCGWEDNFSGYVLDYGTYPDQHRPYFTLRDAKHTLASVTKGAGLEGQIYAGLEALTDLILGREWGGDGGAAFKVEKCLIDANWGQSTPVVRRFCRQSKHAAILNPSHGHYIGAGKTPMGEWQKRAGEKVGQNWRLRSMENSRKVRSVLYDTNAWKSFIHTRLHVAMGDPGCLSLFGDKADVHRCFADHLTAEFRVETEGRGRKVDEWHSKPERPDNHWLDCLVGCAVAASVQGVSLAETAASTKVASARPKVSLKERQRLAMERQFGQPRR